MPYQRHNDARKYFAMSEQDRQEIRVLIRNYVAQLTKIGNVDKLTVNQVAEIYVNLPNSKCHRIHSVVMNLQQKKYRLQQISVLSTELEAHGLDDQTTEERQAEIDAIKGFFYGEHVHDDEFGM